MFSLIDKLADSHSLSLEEYEQLIRGYNNLELRTYAADRAMSFRKQIYGNSVFLRGLIEISNICKNNCRYCGIRANNKECSRYRLTEDEIMSCCEAGYDLGFRTFVLQGGEDGFYKDDVLCHIISSIKNKYSDCAVTLSVGERSYDSYKLLFDAGADRYLLRHETATKEHYNYLHPTEMSFEKRIECLKNLKEIGYQVGCGFMVGSPGQTVKNLAKDLKFIEEFQPHMCGIGPFIPHKETPFRNEKPGDALLTCFLLSLIRIIHPRVLLPATTALATLDQDGRKQGLLAGANVVMPNLSPSDARLKYEIYANKKNTGCESADHRKELEVFMHNIGFEAVTDRGDFRGS